MLSTAPQKKQHDNDSWPTLVLIVVIDVIEIVVAVLVVGSYSRQSFDVTSQHVVDKRHHVRVRLRHMTQRLHRRAQK